MAKAMAAAVIESVHPALDLGARQFVELPARVTGRKAFEIRPKDLEVAVGAAGAGLGTEQLVDGLDDRGTAGQIGWGISETVILSGL
jgi:hypothetical protein